MKQIAIPFIISSGVTIATFLTLGFLEDSFVDILQTNICLLYTSDAADD